MSATTFRAGTRPAAAPVLHPFLHSSTNRVWKTRAPLGQASSARFPPPSPRVQMPALARAGPRVPPSALPGKVELPAAPIQVPEGPWRAVPGGVAAPQGFRVQGMYAELRLSGEGKADLGLVVSDRLAWGAGSYTTNVMCAAPVSWCKRVLSLGRPVRALLVNSGQANAATGSLGDENVRASAAEVARVLGLEPDAVLLQSTGVIGKQVRMEQLLAALPTLAKGLERSEEAGRRLAVAMTTTDLAYKSVALELRLPESGRVVRLGGAAKGSGMIHPNMATMLGVVTCDAAVDSAVWQVLVSRATDASYNQITVDGDTSTNDCVLALCNGAAVGDGQEIKSLESADARALGDALTALCQGLAKSIAWDGEGATMLLECQVSGAGNDADARRVAKSVVGSSLVKAAMFGCYPNWGRLAAAAGYAGVSYLQESVAIRLGDIALMRDGQPLEFDFEAARAYLRGVADAHGTAHVHISIGTGPGKGKAWGCDLSYDYVKINVEYS